MDMRKFAGKSFIKLADVSDGPLTDTIAAVRPGKFEKPNLIFESGAALSLNATNNKALIRAYGPNSEDWIGKEVELYGGEIEFQNRMMPAVLVRPISPALKPAERTKIAPEFGDDSVKPTAAKRKAPTKKSGDFGDDSEIPY